MSDSKLENLLNDIHFSNEATFSIVQEIRKVVRAIAPSVSERVMYGGVMFTDKMDFCGVFAYAEHVSLEFGRGCDLQDPHGVLEGSGKFRRHIKIKMLKEIKSKHLREYVASAHSNSVAS